MTFLNQANLFTEINPYSEKNLTFASAKKNNSEE